MCSTSQHHTKLFPKEMVSVYTPNQQSVRIALESHSLCAWCSQYLNFCHPIECEMVSYCDLSSLVTNEFQYVFMFCFPFMFSHLWNVFCIFVIFLLGCFVRHILFIPLCILLASPAPSTGFVNSSTKWHLDRIILLVGNGTLHYSMFSISINLYPLDTNSSSSCDNKKSLVA